MTNQALWEPLLLACPLPQCSFDSPQHITHLDELLEHLSHNHSIHIENPLGILPFCADYISTLARRINCKTFWTFGGQGDAEDARIRQELQTKTLVRL